MRVSSWWNQLCFHHVLYFLWTLNPKQAISAGSEVWYARYVWYVSCIHYITQFLLLVWSSWILESYFWRSRARSGFIFSYGHFFMFLNIFLLFLIMRIMLQPGFGCLKMCEYSSAPWWCCMMHHNYMDFCLIEVTKLHRH